MGATNGRRLPSGVGPTGGPHGNANTCGGRPSMRKAGVGESRATTRATCLPGVARHGTIGRGVLQRPWPSRVTRDSTWTTARMRPCDTSRCTRRASANTAKRGKGGGYRRGDGYRRGEGLAKVVEVVKVARVVEVVRVFKVVKVVKVVEDFPESVARMPPGRDRLAEGRRSDAHARLPKRRGSASNLAQGNGETVRFGAASVGGGRLSGGHAPPIQGGLGRVGARRDRECTDPAAH